MNERHGPKGCVWMHTLHISKCTVFLSFSEDAAGGLAYLSKKFETPKYGVLFSVRHKAKETYDLVNLISIKFGSSVRWREPSCIKGAAGFDSRIWRKNLQDPPIWFKLHGKFTNYLELYCQDIEVLEEVKLAFPNDFQTEVQVKEGLC